MSDRLARVYIDVDPLGQHELFPFARKVYELSELIGVPCGLKIGDAIECRGISEALKGLHWLSIMVDNKYHDTPDRIERKLKEVFATHVPALITVSAFAGEESLRQAVRWAPEGTRILASTTLSSWDNRIPYLDNQTITNMTINLAQLARQAKVFGITCHPSITRMMARSDLAVVAAGIRSQGVSADNHKFTLTPQQAFAAGATAIVIGREVTQAQNRMQALRSILQDVKSIESASSV